MKDSFIIYKSFYEPIKTLPDQDLGIIFRAVCEYQFSGELPKISPLLMMAFLFIKDALDRDKLKYERIVERNKNNGISGGRPKKEPKKPSGLKQTQNNPKNPVGDDNDNDTDTDTDTDTGIDSIPQKEFAAQVKNDFFITSRGRELSGKRLETFILFWDKFNYKKGKAEAADAWLNIPELTYDLCNKIYNSAELEAKNRDAKILKGQTPKYAQGWIKARRWEDEIIDNPEPEYQKPQPYYPAFVREGGSFDFSPQALKNKEERDQRYKDGY
jgi:hypothetical protein